jgi:hypothetical protein
MLNIATIHFDSFPIWLSDRKGLTKPDLPSIFCRNNRVVHGNAAAARAGITENMPLQGALQRHAKSQEVHINDEDLIVHWDTFVEELYEITPWLFTPKIGVVHLKITPTEAAELATAHALQIGVATSLELSHLAAVTCNPGSYRNLSADTEESFIANVPIRFLARLGMPRRALERLGFLAISHIGMLKQWSRKQVSSFLGQEAKIALRITHEPGTTDIPVHQPKETVIKSYNFEDPAFEAYEIEPVISHLASKAAEELGKRTARRIIVRATFNGVSAFGARLSKHPVSSPDHIYRLALQALQDSRAIPVGIDEIELRLSTLQTTLEQPSLWRAKEQATTAITAVTERFPDGIVRLVWIDSHSQAPNRRYRWESIESNVQKLSTPVEEEPIESSNGKHRGSPTGRKHIEPIQNHVAREA